MINILNLSLAKRELRTKRNTYFFNIQIRRQTHVQKLPKHQCLSRGIELDEMILPQ